MTDPKSKHPAPKGRDPEPRNVAPEDENFEHQLRRWAAEREARRAAQPGLYR